MLRTKRSGQNLRLSRTYNNLFCAKAFPEPDFRYFSNSKALFFSLKALQVMSSIGKRVDVNET